MKAIDIFLRAIEESRGMKKGVLISKTSTTTNSKFPAYTDTLLEIYEMSSNDDKTNLYKICTVSRSDNLSQVVAANEIKQHIEDEVAKTAMVMVLKHYGI